MILTQTNVFDSSTVDASNYNYKTKQLFISFKHATYIYNDVEVEDYESFKNAESQGKAVNEFIKSKYQFQKVEAS